MPDLVTILDANTGTSVTEASLRHPVIAWQNILADDDATLTPSSEVAGYLAINAIDGKEFTFWKLAAAGTQSLEVEFTSPREVNYCAIHGHNMASAGGSFTVQKWSGAAWVTLGTTVSPGTGAPAMVRFATESASRFRILFSSSVALQLAVVYLGKSFQMERGCWSGMTPPWMGRVTSGTTTKSEAGVLLGRSVALRGVKFEMAFEWLTIPFVRDYWMPFVVACEESPFFVLWNPADYPDDVAFCWIEDPERDLSRPTLSGHSHMKAGANIVGRVDGSLT